MSDTPMATGWNYSDFPGYHEYQVYGNVEQKVRELLNREQLEQSLINAGWHVSCYMNQKGFEYRVWRDHNVNKQLRQIKIVFDRDPVEALRKCLAYASDVGNKRFIKIFSKEYKEIKNNED